MPAVPGDYTGITSVRVLLDGGRPVQVLGPAGSIPVAALSGATPALPPPACRDHVDDGDRLEVILPTVPGTWRVPRASWGRWGGSADVYGATLASRVSSGGSPATASRSPAWAPRRSCPRPSPGAKRGLGYSGNWVATVRGCASGTLPGTRPTYLGDTATAALPGAGKDGVAVDCVLPATVREQLRTGSTKSLGLVGAPYGSTYGAGRAATLGRWHSPTNSPPEETTDGALHAE